MSCSTIKYFQKSTGEDVPFDFDFTNYRELSSATMVSGTLTVTEPEDGDALTVGVAAVSGKVMQFRISGGSDGTYELRCTAVTSAGLTIEGFANLNIYDGP